VDSRERDVAAILSARGVVHDVQTLSVCDYLLLDPDGNVALALERKTVGDLEASVRDGRLVDQRARMRQAYAERGGFVVEGAVNHGDPALAGVLTGLIVRHRFPVFRTAGKEDTATLLSHLEASAARGRLDPRDGGAAHAAAVVPKKKVQGHEEAGINMLACVSGVSAAAAAAILAVHADIPSLVDALRRSGERAVSDIALGKKRLGKVGEKIATAFNIPAARPTCLPARSTRPPNGGGCRLRTTASARCRSPSPALTVADPA
jgi:ERCC4-type nuclease